LPWQRVQVRAALPRRYASLPPPAACRDADIGSSPACQPVDPACRRREPATDRGGRGPAGISGVVVRPRPVTADGSSSSSGGGSCATSGRRRVPLRLIESSGVLSSF